MILHTMSTTGSVNLQDVRNAHERIRSVVRRTPVLECEPLNAELGADIAFKCENLQHIGAFKARGACNAVMQLTAEQRETGVVTHSSGNHAAALARAAKLHSVPSQIVMPHNSQANKLASVRSLGVEPVLCEPDAESRQATADEIITKTGATLIHPYDDRHVIAGQGTIAIELLEQFPNPDVVLIPVGGGGLLSGCLTAIKGLSPQTRVIAVEPALADDAARSLQSGRIELPVRYDTVADGLRTPLGQLTFPIIQQLLDDILLVEEDEIVVATRRLVPLLRTTVEPSGAVTFACLLKHAEQFRGKRVAVVISGGNLDFSSFSLVP